MKRKICTLYIYPCLLLIALFLSLSCEKFSKPDSPVIARVGRSFLTLDDLNKSIPAEYSDCITREQRINYVKQWIDTELLYQDALRQKIDKEKEIRKRLEKMKKDLLGAEMISRNSFGVNTQKFSEEAINNYYEQHKESFIRESDVVKYIDIVVDNLKTGWKVRNMVTPDNFLKLAAQFSNIPVQDPNTLSYIPLKSLPPEISEVIFTIRINGTTSPIKLSDGVHLIRVLDKQKAGEICLLQEIKDEIIGALSTQSQKKDIENLLADLRQKTDYEFHFELITQGENMPLEAIDSSENMTDSTDNGLK